MGKRRPQPVCKCRHAKSKHIAYTYNTGEVHQRICTWCWDKCPEFEMDNLKTLEKLSAFKEQKEEVITSFSM
jgi:hypothetical protein